MKTEYPSPLDRKTADLMVAIYNHQRKLGASRQNALEQASHFLAATRQEISLRDVFKLAERTLANVDGAPLSIGHVAQR